MLKRLKLAQKLALIAAILIASSVFLIYQLFAIVNTQIVAYLQQEVHGIFYIEAVAPLNQTMQLHRGTMAVILSGDTRTESVIKELRERAAPQLKKFKELNEQYGVELDVDVEARRLINLTQELLDNAREMTAEESWRKHTDLNESLVAVIRKIGDTGNLLLDSDLPSHTLINVVVVGAPPLLEEMGQIRGISGSIAATRTRTRDQALRLNKLLFELRFAQRTQLTYIRDALRYNPGIKALKDMQIRNQAVTEFVNLIEKEISNKDPQDITLTGTGNL